jgi:hypothetical protein
MSKNVISSNANMIVPKASLFHFGILTSSVHNSWMRTVGGRLKSDYRYSGSIVYNTFPWPNATTAQQEKIENLAQAVLDARNEYPNDSLADMYNEVSMPFYSKLVKAHQALDREVLKLYKLPPNASEAEVVAKLMELYAEQTATP